MSGEVDAVEAGEPGSLLARATSCSSAPRVAFQPGEVGHMGIYVGNGWFVHSSRFGTTLTPMTGWYETTFAWGRSPLVEAGLEY